MIVEWNPETVKRQRGSPLSAALDSGGAIAGKYIRVAGHPQQHSVS
jgi:hypothetical protein